MMCVRNTKLENIHAGMVPVTKTGDYSDVVVIDAEGRGIPWPEVSHIDDAQMRELMKDIVNRLYTFHMRIDARSFRHGSTAADYQVMRDQARACC